MKKPPAVRQRDFTDCGAACLSSILAYHGQKVPVARIRQLAGTDTSGTSVWGMVQAANQLGLFARAVRAAPSQLCLANFPAIVHIQLENKLAHFLVISAATDTKFHCMDPATGTYSWWKKDRFEVVYSEVLLLFTKTSDVYSNGQSTDIWLRFLRLLKPHRSSILLVFLGSIIYTLLGFSMAIFLQQLVDGILISGNRQSLHLMATILVILLTIQAFIGLVRSLIGFITGQLIDQNIVSSFISHLFLLPASFLMQFRVGEMVSRVGDAVKIRLLVNDLSMGILLQLLILMFSAAIMFIYHTGLAIFLIAATPVYAGIYYLAQKGNKKWERSTMESAAAVESEIVMSLQAAETIKAYSLESYITGKILMKWNRLLQALQKSAFYNLHLATVTEWMGKILLIVLLWRGALLVMDRQLSIGELLSFYSLAGYFTSPAIALVNASRNIQEALISADRLFEVIDLETELLLPADTLSFKGLKGRPIRFEHIFFRYGNGAAVFDDLNFIIPAGMFYGIVGETGSGKSTIAALLQGRLQAQSGHIFIGNDRLDLYSRLSIRRNFVVVPQQVHVFKGTIWENIILADPNPDPEKMLAYSKACGLHDLVVQLKEQYGTELGEGAMKLSGGQLQLLAMTRALYLEPDVLILDEASAHLDAAAELRVLDFLKALKQRGCTIILITHRLQTLRAVDGIVVLKSGKLEAMGSHQQLLTLSPYYKQLFEQGDYWG